MSLLITGFRNAVLCFYGEKAKDMIIRQADAEDLSAILAVHESAFGQTDEALLTADLLADPSAAPQLSLIAILDG